MTKLLDHILEVRSTIQGQYGWFDVYEYWLLGEEQKYWVRHIWLDHGRKKLNGIQLYAQIGGSQWDKMYAMDLRYQGSDYVLRDLEQMEQDLRRIRTIKTKFDKIGNEWGYPNNFARFVFTVAKCVGAAVVKPYMSSELDKVELRLSDLEYLENELIVTVKELQ